MEYPRLFSPIQINTALSRNRIVAAPIGDVFEEKAAGGAGIVICGHTVVEPGRSSFASPDEPSIFHKYAVEEARARIRKCRQYGALASIELFHAGQYARVRDYAVGPVAFTRADGVEVRALDRAGMESIADCFADAARDAKDLGFDMVFLHFGHGWLVPQFLSPLFNSRTDEFGGSLENRMRFPLMVLSRIRAAVGHDYPIDMRVSAVEWVPGSIAFEDTLAFVKEAERYIDSVQVSAGLDINHEGNVHMVTTNFKGHMVNRTYARQIKNAVSIPVSVVGAVLSPAEAEELLAAGDVDLVAFGRSFIADPDWPNKAKDGRTEDIRPCIRCLQCYHISTNRRDVGCSVNPRYRNEDFTPGEIARAERVKTVAVVGGGPAGMMAALTAAQRGHRVVLFERGDALGGALRHVAMEHYKEDIRRYLAHLLGRMSRSGVEVRLNTEATPDTVAALAPDAIVVAVGAKPALPEIPGRDLPHVMGFFTAIERQANIGTRVVILGGGTIGAEIGLELSELQGKTVHLVELTDTIAAQGNMLYRIALRQKMEVLPNLICHLQHRCVEIAADGVRICGADGCETFLPADTVIIATGLQADRAQVTGFYGITPDTFVVGDCHRPRKIMDATFEGFAVASRL